MKERIESFDFIRAICAWIIVVYHFADIFKKKLSKKIEKSEKILL